MNKVPPLLLSAIICDWVVLDAYTRRLTIRDTIHTIAAYDYPATHPRLVFFFELTDGHGEVEVVVKLIDVTKDDEPLWEIEPPIKITFADTRQVIAQHLHVTNINFPHPGEYRFQLFVAKTLLVERRLVCIKIEKPKKSDKNETQETH